ncbi:hypothetical protein [Streptomyces bungoensis]|uniref:hypothetical protein n=1 Tax=Streptomyces bungoensis TaxID=285568 RepID=UPI0033CD7E24
MPGPRSTPAPQPGRDTTSDVIRWAAFSCVLVPVVLLWYGTSLAGAAGTAFGLAAVTAACRVLLRRSERCAGRGTERSGTQRGGGRHTWSGTPVD